MNFIEQKKMSTQNIEKYAELYIVNDSGSKIMDFLYNNSEEVREIAKKIVQLDVLNVDRSEKMYHLHSFQMNNILNITESMIENFEKKFAGEEILSEMEFFQFMADEQMKIMPELKKVISLFEKEFPKNQKEGDYCSLWKQEMENMRAICWPEQFTDEKIKLLVRASSSGSKTSFDNFPKEVIRNICVFLKKTDRSEEKRDYFDHDNIDARISPETKDFIAGKKEGEESKARDIAKNLIELGLPLEQVSKATGLDLWKLSDLI